MENFTFYAPTYFAFGKDTENDTGKYVKRFGGSRVLLHYGRGSVIRSGLLDRVKKSLDAEGISYVELGGVKPNPRSGLVYEGIDLCRKEKVDFVLAVGGGSTIDSAKAIAAGAVYDGDFWDYYEGKLVEEALPIGTVITISADFEWFVSDDPYVKADDDTPPWFGPGEPYGDDATAFDVR